MCPHRTCASSWDDARVHKASFFISATVVVSASLALSSCSTDTANTATQRSFPELRGFEAARDQAARSEFALAKRTRQLEELVDESLCAQCGQVLTSITSASSTRLEKLGGMWDPWADEDTTAQSAAVDTGTADAADAPQQVKELISWMILTAQRDLSHSSDPDISDTTQALALARIGLGRYLDAIDLASAYDITPDAGQATVGELNARLDSVTSTPTLIGPNPPLPAGLASWFLNSTQLNSATALEQMDFSGESQNAFSTSTELSQTVATWDCVAQTLPRTQVVDANISDASTQADRLLTRSSRYLNAGAADTRTVRCRLASSDPNELANDLIDANLSLLASDSHQVRLAGLHAALEDIDAFHSTSHDGLARSLGR